MDPASPAPSGNRAQERYGSVAQAFHWLTAVLVLVAFVYGPGGSEQRVYATSRDADRHFHETLGLIIFTFAFVRLLWRAVDRRPDPPAVPRWMGVLLLAKHHDLGLTLATVHGWLGDIMMWLAGLHALAAFYHHWVLGDGVLVSMLPAWLRLRPKRVRSPS